MRKVLGLVVLLAACDGSDGDPASPPRTQPTTAPTSSTKPPTKDAGTVQAGPHANAALVKCAESKGDIASIGDVVTRLNGIIAKGGDGACFVATLPRPLSVVATLNMASAQPAGGRGAPRIFFMLPKVVITAVPDGDGSKVIELGEWTGSTSTIKGEFALPVTTPLAADAPFKRILQGTDRTVCATCHKAEAPHPTIANAFISDALRPTQLVTLEELEELHTLCTNAGTVSTRCDFIHALFDFGEVTQGAFSPAVHTMN